MANSSANTAGINALSASPAPAAAPASPFQQAHKREKKYKIFLWGSWGTGKTTIALQFPKPVVIDLDGGADLYGDKFKFAVLKSANLADVKNAIAWLINTPGHGGYDTLVLDPITVYWEILQKYWSDVFTKRNKGYKANKHEFYELGPKEWSTIRQDFRTLFDKLLELDMHVVVTARETANVKRQGNDFVNLGEKFDGEKGIPYLFDTVIHLFLDEKGRFTAHCSKDRTERLPRDPFEISYKVLAKYFGLPNGVAPGKSSAEVKEA